MNILARNFERLRSEGWKKVFDALERVLTKMEIDFYLIGAVARDVWIDHLSYRDKRTTRDVDICVYVRDLLQYKNAASPPRPNGLGPIVPVPQ